MRFLVIVILGISLSEACFAYSSADFNTDGFVDFDDLVVLMSQWLNEPSGVPSANLDSVSIVDFADFALFAAQWQPHMMITLSGAAGADGVTMNGLPGSPVTSGGGFYIAYIPFGWHGTIIPTKAGYSFSPTSISYIFVTSNLSGRDFIATPIPTFTISGTTGVDGVTMNGLPDSPVTSGGGFYSAVVPYGWDGTITPTKTGYTFSPASKTYTDITSDLAGGDFTATQIINCTISGITGVDGITMNGLPGNPITSGGGLYSAIVPYGWSGTITPVLNGYTFSPLSVSYTDVTSDMPNRNFAATQVITFVISGTTGVDGVTINGLPGSPVTSGGGFYSAIVPSGWSGTVLPTKTGYIFSPASASYSNVSINQIKNYTPTNENCIQWPLSDNANNNTVSGSELNGQIFDGGNNYTSTVSAMVNGIPAFHLNGSTQYVRITIPNIWPSALANLWTKYSGNPVLSDPVKNITYGQLAAKPGGGWYFFCSRGGIYSIYRWESTDLITWSNQVEVLPAGGAGAWDSICQVATAFQKPDDNMWVMFYRGWDGTNYRLGKATSIDGTTFVRKDNGGIDNGLLDQFGGNYDAVGTILVGATYYMYVNGAGGHGVQNLYTSTDLNTWTADPKNSIFMPNNPGDFCSHIWSYNDLYYLLVCRDFGSAGGSVGNHAIGLYRSPSPAFPANNREFLGYPIINDQPYDIGYLDTPSVPSMNVYRTSYPPEFGNILYCLYSSDSAVGKATQSLAYTTLTQLQTTKPKVHKLYGEKQSYSFWVQFDRLNFGDVVFSVGSSAADSSPVWLCSVRSNGINKVLTLLQGSNYGLSTTPLSINTPYHIVIVQELNQVKMYINGIWDGYSYSQQNTATDAVYLYIGTGYNHNFFNGYAWDFRIYPAALDNTAVNLLYRTGSIDTSVQ